MDQQTRPYFVQMIETFFLCYLYENRNLDSFNGFNTLFIFRPLLKTEKPFLTVIQ